MRERWVITALLIGLIVAALVGLIQTIQLHRANRAAWVADTTARNARARADTTRQTLVTVGDSVRRLAERLAEQTEVTGRLRGRALIAEGERGAALATVSVLADSLERLTQSLAHIDTAGVLHTAGRLDARDSLGLTVDAAVMVTGVPHLLGPLAAAWRWQVAREPMVLEVALICQDRDAVARVRGPPWASFELREVAQDPAFCNPAPGGWEPFRLEVPSVAEVGLIAAVTLALRGLLAGGF